MCLRVSPHDDTFALHTSVSSRVFITTRRNIMRKFLLLSALPVVAATTFLVQQTPAPPAYVPRAQFCVDGSSALCPKLPAAIGQDSALRAVGIVVGYSGILGPLPATKGKDVETPFDNMAWQMFVALNWAQGAQHQPASKGLAPAGPRMWQSYRKVSSLFGDSPRRASCANPKSLPVFAIGSDGKGNNAPNNEEYFQASTNLPLIDVNGNWTLYERRVNDIEAKYLLAPNGNAAQTLTTLPGQVQFIANKSVVKFTAASIIPTGANGSIEIKASWRVLNPAAGDDPTHYYTQSAIVAVPGDLVRGGQQVCDSVTLGLVGMHIIQRNAVDTTKGHLLDQWIWATFEHSENAPMAKVPCSVSTACTPAGNWINKPSCGAAAPATAVRYSFYNPAYGSLGTNIIPTSTNTKDPGSFLWNHSQPYAKGATTAASASPQVTRCWSIYPYTAQIDSQWQRALAVVNSPFKYYTLIGTQWGGLVEPREGIPLPSNAVPALLSNTTLETYIQNYTGTIKNGPAPGSCIGCHGAFSTLSVGPQPRVKTDFSFLPGLVQPLTARKKVPTVR
jgi:hypothetical protein